MGSDYIIRDKEEDGKLMSFGKVATDKDCLNCGSLATWVHSDGIYLTYYCDVCIVQDDAGEQAKIENLTNGE